MSTSSEDDQARWNARYSKLRHEPRRHPPERSVWSAAFENLVANAELGGRAGMAIDLAGGDGAGAVGLARLGFDAVVVDVSDVALGLATERAAAAGVSVRARRMNLASSSIADVLTAVAQEGETVAVVSCVHYLNRDLLRSVPDGLPSGAVFMASVATTTNLERNVRPSARFLLAPGELQALVVGGFVGADAGGDGFEVLHNAEGWNEDGAHEAELVVRAI